MEYKLSEKAIQTIKLRQAEMMAVDKQLKEYLSGINSVAGFSGQFYLDLEKGVLTDEVQNKKSGSGLDSDSGQEPTDSKDS